MFQAAGYFRLEQKPDATVGTAGVALLQPLECHFTVELAVVGDVHLPKAAPGVLSQDLEPLVGSADGRSLRLAVGRQCRLFGPGQPLHCHEACDAGLDVWIGQFLEIALDRVERPERGRHALEGRVPMSSHVLFGDCT